MHQRLRFSFGTSGGRVGRDVRFDEDVKLLPVEDMSVRILKSIDHFQEEFPQNFSGLPAKGELKL
jgi:hypothetical protein